MVGRADEHRQLVGAYRQIGRDKTQVVALIGAAGVGKTRLVDAFLAWATLDAPEIETWQGRAHLALGQFEAARAALLDARAAAEEQEERAMLWRVLVTLSELEQAGSNTSAAGRLRDQARAVVDDIAAHAGRLRVIFMDQPAVVQLLEESL